MKAISTAAILAVLAFPLAGPAAAAPTSSSDWVCWFLGQPPGCLTR